MSLDTLINLQISKQTSSVSRVGFGTQLILTYHNKHAARTLEYTKASDMLVAAGGPFSVEDQAYVLANVAFAQDPKPSRVLIGRRVWPTIRTVKLTIVDATIAGLVYPLATTAYTVTINGVDFTFTTDATPTALEICVGLTAAINAGAVNVKATNNLDGTITIEKAVTPGGAATAGEAFTISRNRALITIDDTTPVAVGGSLADEIAAISAIDDDWYGICGDWYGEAETVAVANAIESQRKLHSAASPNDDILDIAVTDDIGSNMLATAYARTFIRHHPTPETGVHSAILGKNLPKDPGSETWMFKTLAGIAFEKYTAGEISAMKAKNVERYIRVSGQNMTADGKTCSGEYIDITRFVDWLHARMQENIFGRLKNLDKVGFTGPGAGVVENEIRGTLAAGISAGGLTDDPEPIVTVPSTVVGRPGAVSANDKANRLLSGITFKAWLAGAIHELEINGIVTN